MFRQMLTGGNRNTSKYKYTKLSGTKPRHKNSKFSKSQDRINEKQKNHNSPQTEEEITLMDSSDLPLGIPTPPPLSGFFAGIILPCPSSSSSPHPQQRCMLEGEDPSTLGAGFPSTLGACV